MEIPREIELPHFDIRRFTALLVTVITMAGASAISGCSDSENEIPAGIELLERESGGDVPPPIESNTPIVTE